jgi:hypothetical protein
MAGSQQGMHALSKTNQRITGRTLKDNCAGLRESAAAPCRPTMSTQQHCQNISETLNQHRRSGTRLPEAMIWL